MNWLPKADLHFDFYSNGMIKNVIYKETPLWTIGAKQLPVLELALRTGSDRRVIQPVMIEELVRTSPHALRVGFNSCVDVLDDETWDLCGEYSMELLEDGTINWQLSITNNSPYPVCEILYPRTMPVYFGKSAVLMYPHHAGEQISNVPCTLASEKYQKFWRAESVPTSFGYAREINYCGLASMTWMDISHEDAGLYVGSHDPDFPVTGLRIETGGPDDPWVSLSIRKYVDVLPGHSYTGHPVVWAFHDGDWHLSAHRYRQWFDTLVKQMEHPADLREEMVLSPHYNFRRFDGIEYRFKDIPAMAQKDRDEFGSRHFFIAAWNHMGFDSHYPNYNPDLELGTPLALQQGVKWVNDNDGFATFYINCRIMDKYSEYVDTLGEQWMLRTLEQKAIEETYGPAETFVLCPSHPAWRDHLREFAVWMCQAYGARGIYYDQLGSATPYPCYSDHDHGNQGTSGFNQGYIDLIEQTTTALAEIRSDSFLMIENCGDVYSSRVWGSLAWNGELHDEFFNLYKYTFPEHTLINMVNPRRIEDPEKQEKLFYSDLDRAFTLGSVFWVEGGTFRTVVADPERYDRMLTKLHEALAARRAITNRLADAVFKDSLGLQLPAGVTGTYWEFPTHDGGLILIAKDEGQAGEVALELACESEIVWESFDSETGDWNQIVTQERNGSYVMELPLGAFGSLCWYRR